ncbi:unnamed protein product [Cylindrotheca closterium]|uniref:Uncharacterized protein n=1 Tax=Cylindrotheca closterium TaxID=2856 RepID=A0AAD2GC24_9STRA|nr:unnamed protein product [Cylindrotheca closterium]
MGNCCSQGGSATTPGAFKGEGRRLGSANDEAPSHPTTSGKENKEDLPKPRLDPKLADEDREKQRADRLAAAEARQKKMGGSPKKKKVNSNAPLTGPNSKPLMTWTPG